ncbi:MAG: DUF1570 domain-containing protein [Pirellulaceae bacterium]|jgi:hypothetical protein|nr:DUF1570 domain-containing protein [Pirellulaceae bacterium]
MSIESKSTSREQVFTALLLALLVTNVGAAGEPLISLRLGERRVEGTPLAWSSAKVSLLARDGQVFEFAPDQATDYGVLAGEFRSYSQAEIRGQLLREFGQGYDVSGVGHYLVVHPAGQKDQWAMRFEELYRSFVHYFAARGWKLSEPQFPLIAVVYPRQSDFLRKAAAEGVPPAAGLLGYYSPQTNRILMFDASGGSRDWAINAETIVHEAAHQSAFNTGVHSRYGAQSRWVVEGVGTMFEARGVWQSRLYPTQSDRLNRALLARYRSNLADGKRPSDALSQLITSDRYFQASSSLAYPEAWALSFFLSETEPRKYAQYLAKTAAIPAFGRRSGPERMADFTTVFGTDLAMLDARLQRFVAGLK